MNILCAELQLRALMEADAERVAKATAHWREAENLGVAPPNKGVMRAGGLPSRIVAHLREVGDADLDALALATGVMRRRVAQAVWDMQKRGAVQSRGPGRYALGQVGT